MREGTVFITSDDKHFFDEEEARIHEHMLANDTLVARFGQENQLPTRTLSTLKRWLPQFLAFKEAEELKSMIGASDNSDEAEVRDAA